MTCVGSLSQLHIRLASASKDSDAQYLRSIDAYEVVSLVGTLEFDASAAESYAHLHISVADKHGNVIGGHLMDNNIVFTTAEVTVVAIEGQQQLREFDPRTGYKELQIAAL